VRLRRDQEFIPGVGTGRPGHDLGLGLGAGRPPPAATQRVPGSWGVNDDAARRYRGRAGAARVSPRVRGTDLDEVVANGVGGGGGAGVDADLAEDVGDVVHDRAVADEEEFTVTDLDLRPHGCRSTGTPNSLAIGCTSATPRGMSVSGRAFPGVLGEEQPHWAVLDGDKGWEAGLEAVETCLTKAQLLVPGDRGDVVPDAQDGGNPFFHVAEYSVARWLRLQAR
jgi:hypothetical protein